MILSLGLILTLGFIGGYLVSKVKLPKVLGMILIGMLMGPSLLNILDESLLSISSDLRKIALVIILTKAGLSLDIKQLKEIGRPAILMCFLPAVIEILATVTFAPMLLPITYIEALLLGTVLAAVSPAIIVPRMIKLKDEGKGNNIPDIILAGASLDDILVIMLFYATLGTFSTGTNLNILYELPLSIISGVVVGVLTGFIITKIFTKLDSKTIVVITLSVSFLLVGLETLISSYFNYSSLISIIILGMFIYAKNNTKVEDVKKDYNFLWYFFEIILFVLVGACVDLNVAFEYAIQAIVLITIILIARSIGVYLCLIKTNLNKNEKIFCIISYLPKATVQASIGAIPLSMNLASGSIILSIAVMSIIITAPLGALLIDNFSNKLLK